MATRSNSSQEVESASPLDFLRSLPPEKIREATAGLTEQDAAAILYDWSIWAREKQLAPSGDWDGWLILAGRGFGKTRTGCEWVRSEVDAKRAGRIALIAETSADGRDVLVEGESGLLSVCPPWDKPLYEPSKRRLTWKSGAIATLYDAREPDQLRGPQHDLILFDELAKYRYAQEVFDQAMFGLRLGVSPKWAATTTPRPIGLIKALCRDPRVKVTRGSSDENLANLARTFVRNVIDRYKGTRLGRQELNAEILEDVPGALWLRSMLEEHRVREAEVPQLVRVVVAVDPAATSGENANENGIVIAGLGTDQRGYTLDDWSEQGSPNHWARRAIAAYGKYEADMIVAEANQGGEMVEAIIRSVNPDVPVKLVRASRGKYTRAEPVAALYEQGRISHVGSLATLEDQMCAFTPQSSADRSNGSPDRVDALVWAYTELFPSIIARAEDEDEEYQDMRSRSRVGGY